MNKQRAAGTVRNAAYNRPMVQSNNPGGNTPAPLLASVSGAAIGVVSGDVTPDNFLVDKVMWHIGRRTISPKAHAYLLADDRIHRVELPSDKSTSPCLTDPEIVEVVAHVALNVFTNTLNNVSETEIDFPLVSLEAAA